VDEETDSFRLFNCALCFAQVRLCTACDRGNIYCGQICADLARRRSRAEAARRYQRSFQGALNHANRQATYRVRVAEEVTHQGSVADGSSAIVIIEGNKGFTEAATSEPEKEKRDRCSGCGALCGPFARPDFIGRCRSVRPKGGRNERFKRNRIRDPATFSR
jgi:hypothetical protein